MRLTQRALPAGRDGFALAEVLVAMVILAVGLMALESLAIGAARRITMANFATEYTLIGSERMETALTAARGGTPPVTSTTTLADGTRVDQDVTPTVLGGVGGTLYQVRITVTPGALANARVRIAPVVLTGRVVR
ncbi:type IV pilus modification PilV family protein [Longimicrobium terrae]|uniref:Prepilin-type N-terminal cleavage/methylation domain-containing protein n=1 Tax=Longimicrobium terrae TaxID=1639882 RepID=A0A841H6N7_9BACT|nr:prepilin-type N-terminal cleavage/methylation domain-containing protein [Longimicrobium terrae]MBB4639217.1 prepilin-type N-terminal cleavage/methylation domain-containing protein [Longimicrobium terrae]MBB6073379.1 prepilin-type N-terminal cleavage/methylation domain-containing protein [Longimicrobium terrae]NNC32633.1 prepilin-type N-terminal cleavage/methylation domain-containing protein [Longimicrobium terrae]